MKYKRIFAVIAASMIFLLSSCTKEESINRNYTVTFNGSYGYSTTIIVFECNENGDKIYDSSWDFSEGETKSFTAQQGTKKLKLYIHIESMFGDIRGYVQRVYYLTTSPTSIVVDDNTTIGPNEP